MKFKASNIGCIEQAEINLNGLTVITGENGSGKSTISKMIFSVIKAVANTAQENESSQQIRLEKLTTSLYKRLTLRNLGEIREMLGIDAWPAIPRSLAHKMWEMRGTDSLMPYLEQIQSIIEKSELTPRVKKLSINDIKDIRLLLTTANPAQELGTEIRSFVESEFMNQITTEGKESSHVEFFWGPEHLEGVEFEIKNDELHMVGCTIDNALDDATYIESPLYLPLQEALRRSSTYVEYNRAGFLQPMVPLHVKDISNKYDLLRYYEQDRDTNKFIKQIAGTIGGRFEYDEKNRQIFFKTESGQEFMPINVASGIKTFGLLQILLQIGAIGLNKPLLWDEPENHLHPEWQIRFAEMLVLLSKIGIPIVISTHSPYFLQSIRFYAAKYAITPYLNCYFAERKENGLVDMVDVTNDLSKVFVRLAQPLSFVMNIPNEGRNV